MADKRYYPKEWVSRFAWSKALLGYLLFSVALGYGLRRMPAELWQVEPSWLGVAALTALFQLYLQYLQVRLFLAVHGIFNDARHAAHFTTRKGVLNSLLPTRIGTVLLLPMLTHRYALRWYDFLLFTLVSVSASLTVTFLAASWLWLSLAEVAGSVLAVTITVGLLWRLASFPYVKTLPLQVVLMGAVMATIVFGIYAVLRGLGFPTDVKMAMHFGVALNLLAQVAITPGNLGVRELLLGAMAPLFSLPISVGMVAGAIFFSVRLSVYVVVLVLLEWLQRPGRNTWAARNEAHF